MHTLMHNIRHAYLGMTGSADGPAPNGDGTSADAGMAKYHVLMGRLIFKNIRLCFYIFNIYYYIPVHKVSHLGSFIDTNTWIACSVFHCQKLPVCDGACNKYMHLS